MASPSDWASDWPLLSEARDRIDTIIATGATAAAIIDGPILTLRDEEPVETRLTIAAFQEIIGCGEVPVIAVRDDCGRLTPERVETLLTGASIALLYTPINEIDAHFDSRRDRSIFGPRSNLIDMGIYPSAERSELQIRFFEVRVNWHALVNKLKAAGFLAGATPVNATAQLEPGLPQSAEAINCWPAEDDEAARAADGRDTAEQELRPAIEKQIHAAIRTVYDEAEQIGDNKPPNIRQLPKAVHEELRKTGHWASGNRIMKLGGQYAGRRRKPGKTIASDKRRADFTK